LLLQLLIVFQDPDTYDIMDFEPIIGAYEYLRLSNDTIMLLANSSLPSYQVEPEWFSYYSARGRYGPYTQPPLQPGEPLDAKFWHRLTVAMGTNE
jgi:hypothetical protein